MQKCLFLRFSFTKPEVIEQLLLLMRSSSNPELEMQPKQIYKRPYVACEIISAEVTQIIDCFFRVEREMNEEEDSTKMEEEAPDCQLLDKLFSFLEIKPDTDCYETTAGYFMKSVCAIHNAKCLNLLDYIVRKGVFSTLLSRIANRSIASTLGSLLMMEPTLNNDEPFNNYKSERAEVLKQLLKLFEEGSLEELENAFLLFSKFFSNHSSVNSGKELIRETFTRPALEKLIELLPDKKNNQRAEPVLLLLTRLLKFYSDLEKPPNHNFPFNFKAEEPDSALKKKEELEMQRCKEEFSEVFCGNLNKVLLFLDNEDAGEGVFQFKQTVRKLGKRFLRFFEFLSHSSSIEKKIGEALIHQQFLPLAIRVILRHEWNSILHGVLIKTIEVLSRENEEVLSKYVGSST